MVIIDMTVVNVALTSIGRSLGFANAADLQWVVSAYVLVTGGLVLLGGRAADLVGRRGMFLTGLVLFTAASLASGLGPSPLALVIARAAQGLGAALLTPSALSIITTAYTGAQRAAGLAARGTIGAAGSAAGVLLGGALTSALGWQAVFFINVPIGILAAGLALRMVPSTPARIRGLRELDIPRGVADRRPGAAGPRDSGHRGRRLGLGAHARSARDVRRPARRVRRPGAPGGAAIDPDLHLAGAVADLGQRGDVRRHGDHGRHLLPQLALPPARVRGFAAADWPGLPPCHAGNPPGRACTDGDRGGVRIPHPHRDLASTYKADVLRTPFEASGDLFAAQLRPRLARSGRPDYAPLSGRSTSARVRRPGGGSSRAWRGGRQRRP